MKEHNIEETIFFEELTIKNDLFSYDPKCGPEGEGEEEEKPEKKN